MIRWSSDGYHDKNSDSYRHKDGLFNGTDLPVMSSDGEFSKGDMVTDSWEVYPSTYMFRRRSQQPQQPQQSRQSYGVQAMNNYQSPAASPNYRQPSSAPSPQESYELPPSAPAISSVYEMSPLGPSAPQDQFTTIEWKTQEYKAELTASASYAMYSKTKDANYKRQAGAWKQIKNMAQDQKMSKQEFNAEKSKLYNDPYDLPIDNDVKDFAKYTVLRSWILRDGGNKDQQTIFSEYPQFNNYQEFKQFCEENDKVMAHVLSYLNEISCDIQKLVAKQ